MERGRRMGLQRSMRKLFGMMYMFTILILIMVSRMYMSKHQIVYYKYVQITAVNYNSIELSKIHSRTRKAFK